MAENKSPKIEEINIFEIFEDTKHAIQGDLNKAAGKIEMLDEMATFFRDKQLHVVRAAPEEVPAGDPEVTSIKEIEVPEIKEE